MEPVIDAGAEDAASGDAAASASADSQDPDEFSAHFAVHTQILGVGSYGVVRKATCRRTGRSVAVKTYNKESISEEQMQEIRGELEIHTGLSHPGVVLLEAVYETADALYAVLELLHGGELFDRVVERKQMCEREAAHVTAQILEAVAYLHDHHIMHRDIKLENIVFSQRDGQNVKLVDLGYATRFEDGVPVWGKYGSLRYVAPEVLQGKQYDERADVWSVGSVVYAMLLGRVLFTGDEGQARLQNTTGDIDFSGRFRSLSRGAQDFVRKLLSVDPASRPFARQALQHPWLRQEAARGRRSQDGRADLARRFHKMIGQETPEITCGAMTLGIVDLWQHTLRRFSAQEKTW